MRHLFRKHGVRSASTNATAAFLLGLKFLESGGDYEIVNSLNFLGAYQFGEAALQDLGYVQGDRNPYDNDYGGGWTGADGIRSVEDFLEHHDVQDLAAEAWLPVMWSYIEERGLHAHLGQTIGGIEMTPAAMLAASHLLGTDAIALYIETDGEADLRDPYGTPISYYMSELGHHSLPFGSTSMGAANRP